MEQQKSSILYIEDENWQVVGTSVTVLKRRVNAEVTIAANVNKARNYLKGLHFDLVILDIMMDPDRPLTFEESSLVVVQELLDGQFEPNNSRRTPVVFATAVWDMNITKTEANGRRIQKAISSIVSEMGIEDAVYLIKPFTTDELVTKVKEALNHGTSRRPHNY